MIGDFERAAGLSEDVREYVREFFPAGCLKINAKGRTTRVRIVLEADGTWSWPSRCRVEANEAARRARA